MIENEQALFSRMFLEAFQHMKWMAQTIHQAYHLDESDTYKTCTKDVCVSTQTLIWKWARENVALERGTVGVGSKGTTP